MTIEGCLRTHKLAQTVVLNEETRYLNDLLAQFAKMKECNPTESGFIVEEILQEKRRISPVGKWDEEEFLIGCIERKKKK